MNDQEKDRAELLTVREAARFLKISESTLRRWRREFGLPYVRPPGRRTVRFRREDLERFVADQVQEDLGRVGGLLDERG